MTSSRISFSVFFLAVLLSASCSRGPTVEINPVKGDAPIGLAPLDGHVPHFRTVRGNLNPAARLRKLSFYLKGTTPLAAEYEALNQAVAASNVDTFFAAKTKEYIASPAYVGKMVDRLDEVFRLNTSSGLPETTFSDTAVTDPPPNGGTAEVINSLDILFEEMARTNASWDQLLTNKSYRVPEPVTSGNFINFGSSSDGDYFGEMVTQISTPITSGKMFAIKYKNYTFADKDARVAGAITTARFFNRYSTTNTNKNRGRAAALFRVFLCDEMRAVVQTSGSDDSDLLKMAFPPAPPTDEMHRNLTDIVDPHVNDPSCAACHYKLDPMGKSFLTSGGSLSTEASYGALVFKRPDGTLVNIPTKGLGDIATAILVQPEYTACQVNRFWGWFIQGDVPPTTARLAELTKAFDAMGHRTNDFVSYLVNQPEFYRDPNSVSSSVTLTDVKPMMDRCTNCHSNVTTVEIPSFSTFPIGSATDHPKYLEKITKRLDLAHDGAKRDMPPKASAWQPSVDDIALLKRWIATGARDESGNITVDPNVTQQWLQP